MLIKVMMPSTSILKQEERNWLDLPSDVTANILKRISMVDILENAQKVCTAWRKICKDPAMWRVINMNDIPRFGARLSRVEMCKHAVDRSQGQLVDITIVSLYDSGLHLYVAKRYWS
ncbi:putative F-box domain-containing protein [Helianthus annuus]|uniref:F-box domain-containing protein n=1 Tax=Helianthus annuus TaxID=4232 RepID=A0A251SHI0_HELAN|nr:putative F-box domain-containing protein [Helianthus annuus]KAJ0465657.1 putative F-box domain-containing protein [Helianthus annuus]KAJ0470531.1 putative F-box domain-containing protein [Helianthus annuus]KAJ0487250.1 putative F-box domain-containing protein [Helianthus annuus]KAJ0661362.1 putative F-box domain-containing protein [Helianthus annuus]